MDELTEHNSSASIPYVIRFPKKLYLELEHLAAEQNCSLHQLILNFCGISICKEAETKHIHYRNMYIQLYKKTNDALELLHSGLDTGAEIYIQHSRSHK